MTEQSDISLPAAFAALGDPTRFAIVDRLISQGPQSAGALQDVAAISAPAISRHLRVLREAGVIRQEIRAQHRIYSVDAEAMRAIGTWTMTKREFWDGSLDRLVRMLEDRKGD